MTRWNDNPPRKNPLDARETAEIHGHARNIKKAMRDVRGEGTLAERANLAGIADGLSRAEYIAAPTAEQRLAAGRRSTKEWNRGRRAIDADEAYHAKLRGRNPQMLILGNPPHATRDNYFSVASGLYWFANDWHGGQTSELYSILSTLGYEPGPMERGIQEDNVEALDVYSYLEELTKEKRWGMVDDEARRLFEEVKGAMRDTNPRGRWRRRNSASGPVDPHAAGELELFVENDADLYRQQWTPIVRNLMTKWAKGVYDRERAVDLFMYLMESGARKYIKEFGTPGSPMDSIFNKNTRRAVAQRFRDSFEVEAKLGNYTNETYLPAKYQGFVPNPDITRLDDKGLRSTFSWLAKTGMGRHFGNMPIGWYQQHQFAAIEAIEKAARSKGIMLPQHVRVKYDAVQVQDASGRWVEVARAREIFDRADRKTRGINSNPGESSRIMRTTDRHGRSYYSHYFVRPAGTVARVGRKKFRSLGILVEGGQEMSLWKGSGRTIYRIYENDRGELSASPAAQQFSYLRSDIKKILRAQMRGEGPGRSVNPGRSRVRSFTPSSLPAEVANDPRFHKELRAYKRRHGSGPIRICAVNTPAGSPKYMSAWGHIPEVKYDAPKNSTKGKRVHIFGEGKGRGKKPWLVSSEERGPKYLSIVGGRFRANGNWIYD